MAAPTKAGVVVLILVVFNELFDAKAALDVPTEAEIRMRVNNVMAASFRPIGSRPLRDMVVVQGETLNS